MVLKKRQKREKCQKGAAVLTPLNERINTSHYIIYILMRASSCLECFRVVLEGREKA
jgi:hypothetical protein